jgi:hypothetical protein
MWTNAASGDMSAKLGFPGAILTIGRGLVGDVACNRLSVAGDPFLFVGNRHDAMLC